MATATEPRETLDVEDLPYSITSDIFQAMIEHELIPVERRVYLWDGRLYEKMAKTLPHAAVHSAFNNALVRRLPAGLFVGPENPVRLDDTHLPLPDLIVARGGPLDFFSTRYPDGRDVVLVVEVAVTSLREDLGMRLSRYALTLPLATYLVADIPHHQVLIFSGPRATEVGGKGEFTERVVVRQGEAIRLRLGDVEIEPIPWEDVMR